MGGFMLCDKDGDALHTLSFSEFNSRLAKGQIEFPSITEGEIKDKSKRDPLAKCLALLQTAWFVVQCIARGAQHLAVTELELTTLALSVLNFVMYFLWWDKPFDVGCPVYLKDITEEASPVPSSTNETGSRVSPTRRGVTDVLAAPFRRFANAVRHEAGEWGWAWALFRVLFIWTMGALVTKDHGTEFVEKKRVPVFWAHYASGVRDGYLLPTISVASGGCVFGAIHLIAWSFNFVSHAEQKLWRAASLTVTVAPLIIAAIFILVNHPPARARFQDLLFLLLIFSCLLYIFARLSLLIEAVISLRALPIGAYDTIQWISYIPHIS